ncbi:MAG TPA: molybdenum cofactor guanylyltransferase [Stackebrandtia sp.]|uniref:molybdenum cofactor guanylyltransferase n=1 Tax=Stackebrandtia sp. TaxID=2023065 RepID=UPI002D659AC9|nr:molybdenum cofactor guanylyltransferase [Stackebrandtia sp.]HZE38713.1 molybdenum cofactor guanylyltransferase [Stackebrandtia sp.]
MTDTNAPPSRHAAVILAGGQASRMGGVPKPELHVGDRSMLRRVLDAVPDARPQVVVGDLPARDYIVTIEDQPGGGPVPALAAGLHHVPADLPHLVVLAADLPFITPDVTAALVSALDASTDGAVLIDHHGRRQWLCGAWKHAVLRDRITAADPGSGLRHALRDLAVAEVSWMDSDLPPWFDCDTPAALEYARELEREFNPLSA